MRLSMVTFETQDLIYLDYEIKSTKIKATGQEKTYYIYRFLDDQTKRQIKVYDWSGIDMGETIKKGERYYVRDYVNTRGGQNFLVIKAIGQVKSGKIFDIYKDTEGVTEIETVS